ncbi:MAG: hypothetical protein APF76_15435 [Desulfitibacter sp. BRH_c19]|nr:MAG: hypothetical protein APF76_15435 [Desulfitibacter sp. BRH_c19]
MNKKFLLILATLLVLTGLALNSVSNPTIASVPDNDGVIRVIGESVITAAPDQGIVVVAVETKNADAQKAVAENSKATDKVIAALKSFGLNDDQIKTGSYNVYSYVDYVSPEKLREEQPTQYIAHNSLTITINDDLEKMGQVIDTAIKSGANQVQSVRFELKDSEAVKLQALQAATTQAKSKGEAIAKGAGVTISGIKSISEEGSSYSPYRTSFENESLMMDKDADSGTPTPIVPGNIEVQARVAVEYQF